MALPLPAEVFEQPMDPADVVDYVVTLSQGPVDASPPPVLLDGEGVASYTLTLTPEAVVAGLEIIADGDYAPQWISGNQLQVWFSVIDAEQGSPRFDGTGMLLGIELTIVTTSTPPRTRQRTFAVKVQNQ